MATHTNALERARTGRDIGATLTNDKVRAGVHALATVFTRRIGAPHAEDLARNAAHVIAARLAVGEEVYVVDALLDVIEKRAAAWPRIPYGHIAEADVLAAADAWYEAVS